MSQNPVVAALRDRLKRRGYSHISIVKFKEKYHVSLIEPIEGLRLARWFSLEELNDLLR